MGERSGPKIGFYFSLSTLLVVMTAIAVLCGIAVLLPVSLTHLVIGAIWIAAAGVFITGLIFAEGDERAFCIGATVALSSMWTGPGGRFMMGVHSIFEPLSFPQSVSLWLDLAFMSCWSLSLDISALGLEIISNGTGISPKRQFLAIKWGRQGRCLPEFEILIKRGRQPLEHLPNISRIRVPLEVMLGAIVGGFLWISPL